MADSKANAKPRERMPMFWDGMNFRAWIRLLRKNRCRIAWQYWYMLPLITAFSLFHSAYRVWQGILVGWRIKTTIKHPPLFIVGHWRSGTTLLHELMVLDPRHTHPTTYECFAPNHFVLTEWTATRLFAFLVPRKRPMDNMAVGWHRPQEDEFGLCNLGLPSPYLTIAFPNEPPQDQEYWTLEHVPPADAARWKKVFLRFLQEINHRASRENRDRPDKRIVLKSPPHTGRVKTLREMFPDAKFLHIVRDPFVIFPSTVHLWKTLYSTQGLQKPTFEGLEEYVFANLTRMYERFEHDRAEIPSHNFCEVRYEELTADPLATIRRVYDQLQLGGFDQIQPALEKYIADTKGYETNKYRELAPELKAQIVERWRSYFERYGYATAQSAPQNGRMPHAGTTNGANNPPMPHSTAPHNTATIDAT